MESVEKQRAEHRLQITRAVGSVMVDRGYPNALITVSTDEDNGLKVDIKADGGHLGVTIPMPRICCPEHFFNDTLDSVAAFRELIHEVFPCNKQS